MGCILCGPRWLWQQSEVSLFRRLVLPARLVPLEVVPGEVVGDLGARRRDAVAGVEISTLVFMLLQTPSTHTRCRAKRDTQSSLLSPCSNSPSHYW